MVNRSQAGSIFPGTGRIAVGQAFDAAAIRRKAEAGGFSAEEAEMLASLATEVLQAKLRSRGPGSLVSKEELAAAILRRATRELRRERAKKRAERRRLRQQGQRLVGEMTQRELDE